jgi:hypothetical protein
VALAVWNCGTSGGPAVRVACAAAGGAVVAALALAPFAAAGTLPNMAQALGRLATHDMLSANACNLWWVVGYVLRAWHSIPDVGAWAAVTAPASILGISRVIEIGYPNPRAIGIALTIAAAAWALWTARRVRDLWLLAAAGAFVVHAYATLSAQVHENHLFAAVPFLVLAAAGRRALWPICAAVSAIVALNLNMFYGFGNGVGYGLPRTITIIDASVVLAVLNCVALWRHAVVFDRECSQRAPAPASTPAPADRIRSSGSCI